MGETESDRCIVEGVPQLSRSLCACCLGTEWWAVGLRQAVEAEIPAKASKDLWMPDGSKKPATFQEGLAFYDKLLKWGLVRHSPEGTVESGVCVNGN